MVFTKIMILKGYLLTVNDVFEFVEYLQKLLGVHKKYYKFLDVELSDIKDKNEWLIDNTHELNKILFRFKQIQLYTYPCCSDLQDVYYILAQCIKYYDRIYVECKNCSNFYCCDACMGQTENGYYDMKKVLDEIVEIDEKHICKWCNNDKRSDTKNCNFCDWQNLKSLGMHKRPIIFIDPRLSEWAKNKPIKYYYMLDDCLSCS